MRPAWIALAFLGCGAPPRPVEAPGQPPRVTAFGQDDDDKPGYGKPELDRALAAEHGAQTALEHRVAELETRDGDPAIDDELRVARADLAVRRRFITMVEACDLWNRSCPPRLDDPVWTYDPDPEGGPLAPTLDARLQFDVDGWRLIAVELHGRACACRTIACLDSMGVAIDWLETRPTTAVQGDEIASRSITRARECLFQLRGRQAIPSGSITPEQ